MVVNFVTLHIDGLVQDCSNSIANVLELLQSCTKPSICVIFSQVMLPKAFQHTFPHFFKCKLKDVIVRYDFYSLTLIVNWMKISIATLRMYFHSWQFWHGDTNGGVDKIAGILPMTFPNEYSWFFLYFDRNILLTFYFKMHNRSALVQEMASHRTGTRTSDDCSLMQIPAVSDNVFVACTRL